MKFFNYLIVVLTVTAVTEVPQAVANTVRTPQECYTLHSLALTKCGDEHAECVSNIVNDGWSLEILWYLKFFESVESFCGEMYDQCVQMANFDNKMCLSDIPKRPVTSTVGPQSGK